MEHDIFGSILWRCANLVIMPLCYLAHVDIISQIRCYSIITLNWIRCFDLWLLLSQPIQCFFVPLMYWVAVDVL